jgi:TIR domain-containing protein
MAAHFGPLALQLRSDAIDFYPPFTGSAFTRAGPSVADASFGLTTVDFLDLRQWSGLELARHATRSVITFDTLVCSQGRIPLPFLPGCGLPEKLIEYLPSLFQDPIQFYSCFISYSTMDQDFAARLYGDLQNKGVRCWFAPHDVRGGRKLHEQIDEAIRICDRLLLILSEHSMHSEWVKTEIAHARQKELNEGARCSSRSGLYRSPRFGTGSASTRTQGRVPPVRSGSTSSPISVIGRTTTPTRRSFGD